MDLWIRLIYTNTNAKEQNKIHSVSIQKRALELVLCPPEREKKGRSFFLLFLPAGNLRLQRTELVDTPSAVP